MPKVLFSPKPPSGKGGGRRNFRLSPLEIGVAILVAMGGVYLLYVLLSGLWGGGEAAPPPASSAAGPAIGAARLDKVLSAAEAAQRRLRALDKRLVELDKRLSQVAQRAPAPAGKGGGDPKLAGRVAELEKKLAALGKAPAGKAKADPKLAGRLAGAEKNIAALDKETDKLSEQLKKLAKGQEQSKLAARVASLEKELDALAKKRTAAPAKGGDKLEQRLAALEKQVLALAQRPVPKAGGKDGPSPELTRRVQSQGKVLAGVTATLGKMQREQQRRTQQLAQLEKRLTALAAAKPQAKGAPAKADGKLSQRLAEIEKRLAAQSKARRKGDQADAARLAALEKELARVRKQASAAGKADPKLAASLAAQRKSLARLEAALKKLRRTMPDPAVDDRQKQLAARLTSLEKKLAAADRGEQSLGRRLEQLEKRVSAAPASARTTGPPLPKLVRITHTVRPGQTLYGLARTYGTSLSQIKAWNPKLGKRDMLYIGEKLVIYVRK
jgi:LysM repeat protein